MGNALGGLAGSAGRKFLEPEPVWSDYYTAPWRSERSKELDRHGGAGRPPVLKGDSVTAKLNFLEGALRDDQARMKRYLRVDEGQIRRAERELERVPDIILNTDIRAVERVISGSGSIVLRPEEAALVAAQAAAAAAAAAALQQQAAAAAKEFSLMQKDDPELRRRMLLQRQKMLEYAKGVNVTKGAPAIKPLNLPAIRSKVATQWKGDGEDQGGASEEEGEEEEPLWGGSQPAEWRLRMHAARRRTMLVVAAATRWQLALVKRPGPKRLPRVNSFSYYIPKMLGVEAARFIEEALVAAKIAADAARAEEPAEEAVRNAASPDTGALSQPPASALPPGLRRGRSDSGTPAASPARSGVVSSGSNGAGALASGMVLPRSRRDLVKSASGKSFSSAPDVLGNGGGHASDAEVTYGRGGGGGGGGGGMLPIIPQLPGPGGRRSSSGLAALPPQPPDGAAPTGPRLPRAQVGRSGSTGRSGRSSRRQSDSSVVAAVLPLPPSVAAAAAAAGAAVPPGSGRGGPKARTSDNGARHRRDPAGGASEGGAGGGGGGGSAFMAGLQQPGGGLGVLAGGVAGMPAAAAARRRSETGSLASVVSAPVEGSSASAGFLPPLLGGGGGAGAGGKIMTNGQARRLALMTEAASGSDDASGRSNMSPSRLGPLKMGTGGRGSVSVLPADFLAGAAGGPGSDRTSRNGGHGSRSPDRSMHGASSPGPNGTSAAPVSILDTLRASRELGGRDLASGALSSPTLNSPGQRGRRLSADTGPPPPLVERSQPSATSTAGAAGPAPPSGRPAPAHAAADPSPSPTPATSLHAAVSSPKPPPGPPPPGRTSAAHPPPLPPTGARLQQQGSFRASTPIVIEGEPASRLAKAEQLMAMYANRVNAQWSEALAWGAPPVLSAQEQELFLAGDAWVPYKLTVLKLLKAGRLVVHIDACEDAVTLADGSSRDVWTTDPWALVHGLRPGSLPMTERIEGVPLGARCLHTLVLAAERLAGREAVARLHVVLAINDDQRNAVVADIIRSGSYGLKPENLILTAQRKRCGYRYDREAQAFLEDPGTVAEVLGSGYALCQLAWLGDAFCVSQSGELQMVMGRTLLERFADGGCEWLVCRRARDLALLSGEGVLDLPTLAAALYAADRHAANMVVQAAPASSLTIPRAYDSTLLSLKQPAASSSATPSASTSPARSASVARAGAGADGEGGGGGGAGVVDLRAAELSSPLMVEALAAVRRAAGHEGWVGLQRYMMHLPTLHGMMTTMGVFRPKLAMAGDVARLSLSAADITADPRAACVAVQARNSAAIITSPNEVEDLIPLLLAQDRSATFREVLTAANSAAGSAADNGGAQIVSAPSLLLVSKPGQRIVLFIAANDVTQLAVNLVIIMARPGRDVVHLVTVVQNSLQLTQGQQLVLTALKQISNAMIEAHAEVVVKGSNGLLEAMEGAVSKLAPQLVVLASAALTMNNLNTASVMGSVTLSVLKRMTLPVVVVTSNSKQLVLTQRRTALRCMAVVEATSRPALNFMCSGCMEPMRGDKLVLAGHHPTRQMTTQQTQTLRRMVDNFSDIASNHRFHSVTRLQLDGPLDKALAAAAEEEAVHLVGLQLPLGTKGVPAHVLGLIRSCKAGVLVYRDTL